MKLNIILLTLFILPFVAAATITFPIGDVVSETIPVQVNATWNGTNNSFFVTLSNGSTIYNESTNNTNSVFLLSEGAYLLTIAQGNQSDNLTFNVVHNQTNQTNQTNPPVLPNLTITVSDTNYEIGENVQLTATTDIPVTAKLQIKLNGNVIETYTLSLSSLLNLIYIPDQAGTFEAVLSANGSNATTTFNVVQVDPLVVDFNYQNPVVNQATLFTATVTGGTPPYTYQWLFSDNTASTGPSSTHYFFQSGSHSATLIVTDAANTQASKLKNFTVIEETFDLEITVRDKDGTFIENIDVQLTDENDDDLNEVTTSSGYVEFNNVRGNYTILLYQINTYYHNDTINISENTNLLITINYSNSTDEETDDEETNTTNETSEETSTNEEISTTETIEETSEVVEETPVETSTETPNEDIESLKQEKLSELNERKFDLKLSAKKDKLLNNLNLYKQFDSATNAIRNAESEDTINEALKQVPKNVVITEENSEIIYPEEEDIELPLAEFLQAKKVTDDGLIKSYEYSANRIIKNLSIKTSTTRAKIEYEGKEEQYTIINKKITGPSNSYAIEVIPKSFAKDVSEMILTGDYEVIESDPIIQFNDAEFTYAVKKPSIETGQTVVLPRELKDPNLLSGLLSFRVGESDSGRTWIYAAILSLIIAGIISGNIISKRNTKITTFNSFAELTGQAIDLIQGGEKELAAQVTPEILMLYASLNRDQQIMLADVIKQIEDNQIEHEFTAHVSSVYETASNGADINAISASYEQVLSNYEKLTPELQETLKSQIEKLDEYLDEIIPADS